jgi:glycolate oxidase FAD binding subunit
MSASKAPRAPAREALDLARALADIVGPDGVADKNLRGWAIDGIVPRAVVFPRTALETARVLAFADRSGLAVTPLGGGTRRALGNPPERLDLVLCTRRLDRILSYEPSDFVVTAQAGVSLDALAAEAAKSGQRPVLDPPARPGSTLGGVLSANASGPHRLLYGTARDLVLGIEAALPDGSVIRSGGRVMKNVAGYDLKRLFLGALGTLGVITAASLKLYAIAQQEDLVVAAFPDAGAAGAAAAALLREGLELAALDLVNRRTLEGLRVEGTPDAARWGLLLSLLGTPEAGQERAAEAAIVCARVGGLGARTLARGEARETWRRVRALGEGQAALRICVPVRETAVIAERAETLLSPQGPVWIVARAASGVVQAWTPADGETLARCVHVLRQEAAALGGSVVIEHAPSEVKAGLDAWGQPPASLSLLRRIKETFDPQRTMSPGRLVGGL